MYIVVGSGPAGVACSKALLDNGEVVTMLDVGLELEPERRAAVETVRETARDDWATGESGRVLEAMKAEMLATKGDDGMPTKLRYGSDYPYRGTEESLQIERERAGGSASFAKGGLSTVWGAQVLPFREEDLDGWPIDLDRLAPYYEKSFEMMGLAAEDDDLTELYPLYHDDPAHFARSEQARLLLDWMENNKTALRSRGVHVGHSRLAIDAESDDACTHCGLKIFGCCPQGSVYDSADTVSQLTKDENFRYESGILVEEVGESADSAIVRGETYPDGDSVEYEAEKVFLACGALPTTRILLRSLGLYDTPVVMHESPYFVLPLLTLTSASDVTNERLNTLSQLYIEIVDEALSEHTIHFELFTYNDLFGSAIKDRIGPLRYLPDVLFKPLLNRLVVAMGYLHSDHMGEATVTLHGDGTTKVVGTDGVRARSSAKATIRKLQKNARLLGFVPLSPLMSMKQTGESFHVGGTFPMTDDPSSTETDPLGRPANYERIHAVDSTVFSTIPASTITASIMAVAYMIGDRHDEGRR